MFMALYTRIGKYTIESIATLGHYIMFIASSLCTKSVVRGAVSLFLMRVYVLGASSVPLIMLVGFFTGLVLALQAYYTLLRFGSEIFLGTAVALTLIRELSPVLTALMVIARAGSATTAQLAVMRISGQIDALYVMNIAPQHYLVRPTIWATLFSLPLLNAIFIITGILSAYCIGVEMLGVPSGAYFDTIESSVTTHDIVGSMIKAVIFGFFISTISCYYGYFVHNTTTEKGAMAVSTVTTHSVVTSSVVILILDYILTSFLI